MADNFYVYEHWRPDIGACFYVGKGRGDRAFRLYRGRNKHHRRIVDKLAKAALCVEVRLISTDLSESQSLALEVERIAYWRGIGTALVNATNGGEGVSGLKHSDETKKLLQKKSKSVMKTVMSDPEIRRKISDAITKRMADPANRRIKSEEMTEAMADPDVRLRISNAMINIMSDPEVRKSRSESMTAFLSDPENRAARTLKNIEVGNRPEARAARSTATTKGWEDPEIAARRIDGLKEAARRPDNISRRAEIMRQRMADPVYREKMSTINRARHQAAREMKPQAGL